eukprot:3094049-Prorocentrum_lima.AAC.1
MMTRASPGEHHAVWQAPSPAPPQHNDSTCRPTSTAHRLLAPLREVAAQALRRRDQRHVVG